MNEVEEEDDDEENEAEVCTLLAISAAVAKVSGWLQTEEELHTHAVGLSVCGDRS